MSEVKKGRIFNIQKYSIHDGPGIRTLVFLKGCPLQCKWCSNPEGLSFQFQIMSRSSLCSNCGSCVNVCPEKIHLLVKKDSSYQHEIDRTKSCIGCGACVQSCMKKALSVAGKDVNVEHIMKIVQQDTPFYWNTGGGVTFGGGEATMQSEFLLEVLKECKELDIDTALETCGLTDWPMMEELMNYVNLFLFDLKHIDTRKHKELTGQGNEKIMDNLEQLLMNGAHVVIRMPLIKGYNDSKDAITGALNYIKKIGENNNLDGIDILPYHKLGVNKYIQLGKEYPITDNPSYSEEELEELKQLIEPFSLPIKIVKH